MATEKPHFEWNTQYFEDRHGLNTKIQLGLIGLAIGLMLMNLSTLFILAPLAVALFWVSYQQVQIDKLRAQYEDASLTLAPRSLLLTTPVNEKEERIQYRDIKTVALEGKGKKASIVLTLEERALVLTGFQNAESCVEQIKAGIEQLDTNQG
mgnify:CR=1 FL=1